MFDPGAHLRLGPVFRPFDLVHNTAMAIAAVDEVPRSRGVLADHCPLAAIRLVAPHAGFVPVQQISAAVPEPSSLMQLGLAIAGLGLMRRTKKRRLVEC